MCVCVFKNRLETIPQFRGAKANLNKQAGTSNTVPIQRITIESPLSLSLQLLQSQLGRMRTSGIYAANHPATWGPCVSHQVSTEVLENWPIDP